MKVSTKNPPILEHLITTIQNEFITFWVANWARRIGRESCSVPSCLATTPVLSLFREAPHSEVEWAPALPYPLDEQ